MNTGAGFHVVFVSVFLGLILLELSYAQKYPEVGSLCQVQPQVPGVCKSLRDCPGAISNLKSDVKPSLCGDRVQGKDVVVCCRTSERISARKCQDYEDELATEGPVSFLPPPFQEPPVRTFRCKTFSPFIVNGRNAEPEEFPHQVALGFSSDNTTVWGCGGTLISKNFVLTAAHCIDTQAYGRPSLVLAGDVTLDGMTTGFSEEEAARDIIGIAEYFKHPQYRRPVTYHDIALVRLEREVKLSRSLRPACLPIPDLRLDKHVEVIASGFGKLGYGEAQSNHLQVVNLQKFGLNECNEFYRDQPDKPFKYPQDITRRQVCAGDKEGAKDSCQGDSGGPLSIVLENKRCTHYVVGVTSFGSTYCGSGVPGVYTNVQSYMDWIESIVWTGEN